MHPDIQEYIQKLSPADQAICNLLAKEIEANLPQSESKVWHAHPVWFLAGNPIVGFSRLKDGVRLMFWSGSDFDEEKLLPGTGKFKDASIIYTALAEVDIEDLQRWLTKSQQIQWDYKNIVKKKGVLEKIPTKHS